MSTWDAVARLLQDSVGSVFPSAQLVVVDAGAVVFASAVGDADTSTIFDLASLTKPLATATLIAQLCESGAIALDEVVRIDAGPCTVRALLSHSSGLPAWRALGDPAQPNRDAVLATIRATPLAYPPGTKSIYSDLGFLLLGALVEDRLGPLDVAFATGIARPLGLTITYRPDDNARSHCAPTEGERRGVVDDANARAMGGVAGHAGLFGTAQDVSALVSHFVASWHGQTGGLLRPSTLRQLWSTANVPQSTWCLGWDRPSPHGSSAGERWPKSGVGHLGFTGTSIWIDPPRRRHVVLLTNRVHPTYENERIKQLRPQLHDLVVATLADK